MSAFDAALTALHADPNLSRPALYRVGGAGSGVSLRVIWGEPQKEGDFAQTGAVTKDIKADVRLVDVAEPKSGDTIEVGGKLFTVVTAVKDTESLTATVTLKFKPASP